MLKICILINITINEMEFDCFMYCRNRILSLWSKDVNRILPITECGVTGTPSEDDPPSASLIREVYTFLDQSVSCNVKRVLLFFLLILFLYPCLLIELMWLL